MARFWHYCIAEYRLVPLFSLHDTADHRLLLALMSWRGGDKRIAFSGVVSFKRQSHMWAEQ